MWLLWNGGLIRTKLELLHQETSHDPQDHEDGTHDWEQDDDCQSLRLHSIRHGRRLGTLRAKEKFIAERHLKVDSRGVLNGDMDGIDMARALEESWVT